MQALIDKATLEKEKLFMETENRDLKNFIDQYLKGLSVREDVVDSPDNPLLIINERLQLAMNQKAHKTLSSYQNATYAVWLTHTLSMKYYKAHWI